MQGAHDVVPATTSFLLGGKEESVTVLAITLFRVSLCTAACCSLDLARVLTAVFE